MRALVIGAFLLISTTCQAQNQSAVLQQELARFQLYSGCDPVHLVVEYEQENAGTLDLTESRIETTVRSRLRSAHIYNDTTNLPGLFVHVRVIGVAVAVNVDFFLGLFSPDADLSGPAATWTISTLGTHSSGAEGAGFILGIVSEYTDIFIDQYLAINESACE